MTRREFRSLSPPAAVRDAIDSLAFGAGIEEIPLREAGDRILGERIDAPIDVPGFDRAAMDGYAVRAADTFGAAEHDPVVLSIAGQVHAGSEPTVTVGEGEAVEVATGAVMPEGSDAVIPVEQTRERESAVELLTAVAPNDHVMARGADIAAGDRTLGPGTRLGPRHLGLLAALGCETVPVRTPPTVGIVSTGEELVQPGDTLRPEAGQIYDVNSHSIAGAVEAAGANPAVYAAASDERDELYETLDTAAAECDLLLTSGSTSAGSADLLYRLIEEEGEKLVHGVALKPGRPMLVGRIFETPYVGLPGYPVSALMVFRTFVAPALREATGRPEPADGAVTATLATRVRYDGGRLRLLPVGLVEDGDGSLIAYAPAKGSGATTTLGETDGLVRMEPNVSLLDSGTAVQVERFDANDPIPSLLGVGEPDPALFSLFDSLENPRYLTLGPADGRRWMDDGIADLLVTVDPGEQSESTNNRELARWERDWGLVVSDAVSDDIQTIEDLRASDIQFVNLDESLGVGRAFSEQLAAVFEDGDPGDKIAGYHRRLPGIESAAHSVQAGRADVGLGLGSTAERLGLNFVELGTQEVVVTVNPERRDKPGVESLAQAIEQKFE